MGSDQLGALPPGFVLDGPSAGSEPPPPDGFMLDQAAPPKPSGQTFNPKADAQQAELTAQQFVDQMEHLGQQMQTSALLKAPHELRGYTPEELAQGTGVRNPRTGQQYTVGQTLAPVPVLDAPLSGVRQMVDGAAQIANAPTNPAQITGMYGVPLPMATPTAEQAGGASQILRGGMEAATPLLPGALAAAPVATLAGLGAGIAAQTGTEAGLNKLGVPQQYSELGGDVAGLVAGGLTGHMAKPTRGLNPEVLAAERVPVDRAVEPPAPRPAETIDVTPEPPPGFEPDQSPVQEPTAPPAGFKLDEEGVPPNDNRNDIPVQQPGERTAGQEQQNQPIAEEQQVKGEAVPIPEQRPNEPIAAGGGQPEATRQEGLLIPNVSPKEMERSGPPKLSRLSNGSPGITQETPEPNLGRLQQFVSRDQSGKPQGYLQFYLDDDLRGAAPPEHALHPEVYVDPSARRQGIASALYDEAARRGYDLSKVSGAETTPDGAAFLNARNRAQQLAGIRSAIAPLADRPEWDLTPHLEDAIADQKTPEGQAIASKLAEGPEPARQAFEQYASDAAMSRESVPVSFFEPPTRQEAFHSAFPVNARASVNAGAPSLYARAKQPATPPRPAFGPNSILAAMRRLETSPNEPVSSSQLRQEFPEIPKPQFDAAAVQLMKDQQVHGMQHVDFSNNTPAEQESLIARPLSPEEYKVHGPYSAGGTGTSTDGNFYYSGLAGREGSKFYNSPAVQDAYYDQRRAAPSADQALAARSLKPVTPTDDAEQMLAQADALYSPGRGVGDGRLYLNGPAMEYISGTAASVQGSDPDLAPIPEGQTMPASVAARTAVRLEQIARSPQVPEDVRPALAKLSAEFRKAANDGRVVVTVPGTTEQGLSHVKETIRQELIHRQQFMLQGGENFAGHVDAMRFFEGSDPALRAAMVLSKNYGRSPHVLAAEVSAWLGAGQYRQLGLTRGETLEALAHYFGLLFEQHGSKAFSVLAKVHPALRKEVYAGIQRGGARSNPPSAGGSPPPGGGGSTPGGNASALRPTDEPGPGAESEGTEPLSTTGERIQAGRNGGDVENLRRNSPAATGREVEQSLFARKLGSTNDDEGKANYSGLGAIESKLVRNLGQTRRASEPAFEAAARAASSRSQASVILKTAMPQIEKALGTDVTPVDFRRALIESRLQGIRQRWQDMASFAQRATDANIEKSLGNLMPILQVLDDRLGLPRHLSDAVASMANLGDWKTVRKQIVRAFSATANGVATVMPQPEFDQARHSPGFQDALRIYKNLVEQPMAENHALNEGVFSTAKGPLDTYYPLVPVTPTDEVRARVARQAYAKPKNIANNFATGLADDYDANMEGLRDRLMQAVKVNNRAALMDTLEQEGLVQTLKPGEQAETMIYAGQEYQAVKRETGVGRQIVQDGKSTFIPPKAYAIPKWLDDELKPIIEAKEKPTTGTVQKIMNAANTLALAGPADFVFHSSNLFGTLVANTPFLGNSLLGKAASLPLLKRFTAIGKVLSTDPTTEEAAGDLQAMAKLGILPDRFGSETFSKKYAEQTGAELKRFSMGPMLYGPKGVDIRARLVMYRLAKEINPNASVPELHMFVNQLGTYSSALQSGIVRGAKKSGLSPFAEAGTTMIRNGINAWTGAGPMPKSGIGLRVWQQLTGGGVGLVAAWVLAYKAYTGQYPWQDKRAKLLQIPANPADRKSALGRRLWGKGPETGYINFTFFNPLVGRGARALGIKGAVDTAREGGKWWQDLEAAQKDMMNSYAHPFLGPVPRAAFVGLTGDEPYETGVRDDRAHFQPQLMPAVRGGAGSSVPRRAMAAAKELNAFYGNVSAATGMGEQNPHDTSDKWTRMIFDLALPGIVGQAQNPYMQAHRLRIQAAQAARQR